MKLDNLLNLVMLLNWLAGISFISYGMFLIYLPLGFISLGSLLMLWVYLVAKMKNTVGGS